MNICSQPETGNTVVQKAPIPSPETMSMITQYITQVLYRNISNKHFNHKSIITLFKKIICKLEFDEIYLYIQWITHMNKVHSYKIFNINTMFNIINTNIYKIIAEHHRNDLLLKLFKYTGTDYTYAVDKQNGENSFDIAIKHNNIEYDTIFTSLIVIDRSQYQPTKNLIDAIYSIYKMTLIHGNYNEIYIIIKLCMLHYPTIQLPILNSSSFNFEIFQNIQDLKTIKLIYHNNYNIFPLLIRKIDYNGNTIFDYMSHKTRIFILIILIIYKFDMNDYIGTNKSEFQLLYSRLYHNCLYKCKKHVRDMTIDEINENPYVLDCFTLFK